MEDKIKYHVKRVEGALIRRVGGINHQKAYLGRLKKYIKEEKNQFIKQEKVNRYNEELKSLEKMEQELYCFINIKIPKYFKRNNIDYSMHLLKNVEVLNPSY